MSECNPARVIRRVLIDPPPEKMNCLNCGCQVSVGECHCGANNEWTYDGEDGKWYPGGSIPNVIITIRKEHG